MADTLNVDPPPKKKKNRNEKNKSRHNQPTAHHKLPTFNLVALVAGEEGKHRLHNFHFRTPKVAGKPLAHLLKRDSDEKIIKRKKKRRSTGEKEKPFHPNAPPAQPSPATHLGQNDGPAGNRHFDHRVEEGLRRGVELLLDASSLHAG